MDGGTGNGSYGEDETTVPDRTCDPSRIFNIVPAKGAGDDAGDEGSLEHC